MAGFLAFSLTGSFPSRLDRDSGYLPEIIEITAAGTAPVFHRIPFLLSNEPFSGVKVIIFREYLSEIY
jgi:hypothetical protein